MAVTQYVRRTLRPEVLSFIRKSRVFACLPGFDPGRKDGIERARAETRTY
jgi:hypothetical protein